MFLEIFLLFVAAVVSFIFVNKDRKLYPPGPYQIPIIGGPFVRFTKDAKKLKEKYGNISSVKVGTTRMIYITDYKLAKEIFSKSEISDRLQWSVLHTTEKEKKEANCNGVILSNGPKWLHTRRFLLRHLRDLGMGKSRMEDIIHTEADEIINALKKTEGNPTHIPFALNRAILNILWQLVASHRYTEEEEDTVNKLIQGINEAQETFDRAGTIDLFPIVKILPKALLEKLFYTEHFRRASEEFGKHIQPFIEEHEKNLNVDDPRDLIDDYLIGMRKEKEAQETSVEPLFFEEDLRRNAFDLFLAGIDTTSNTMRFFIYYMAKYQEEQKKAQQILDEVVPKNTLPGLEHRDQLVYVDALVNEVTRMASFAPFGVSRCASEDTYHDGYLIPKDSILFTCAELSHMDPLYFDNPNEFNPSRFISEDGKFISQVDGFQPFGLGRRQCLGESLAKMDLFLLASAILKFFTIESCEGVEIDLTPQENLPFLNKPKNEQKLIFKLRN